MFLKLNNLMFMIVLFSSTFIIISSSNWVVAWLCLEINLMSLVPLMMYKIKFNNSSSSMKYFLIQAMASIMLLVSIIIIMKISYISSMFNMLDMINISLALKLGMPPFQFWMPQVLEAINFMKMNLILIWQKISPMILMSYSMNNLMVIMIILSALIGALGAINQNNIKKIMFYSSLNHLSWMMVSLMINEMTWILYIISYSFTLTPMLIILYNWKINMITKINFLKMKYSQMFMILILMLVLAGLPPFMGFTMKIMIISTMWMNSWFYFIITPLMISSVISIFYYFKIIWSYMMMNLSLNKSFMMKTTQSMKKLLVLPLTMNLILPMVMWFY